MNPIDPGDFKPEASERSRRKLLRRLEDMGLSHAHGRERIVTRNREKILKLAKEKRRESFIANRRERPKSIGGVTLFQGSRSEVSWQTGFRDDVLKNVTLPWTCPSGAPVCTKQVNARSKIQVDHETPFWTFLQDNLDARTVCDTMYHWEVYILRRAGESCFDVVDIVDINNSVYRAYHCRTNLVLLCAKCNESKSGARNEGGWGRPEHLGPCDCDAASKAGGTRFL